MQIDKENLKEIESTIDNYLKEMGTKYAENPAALSKLEHINRVTKLTKILSGDSDIARVAAKAHDIGRFPQLELFGSFDDGKVLHHYLGENFIANLIFKGLLDPSKELDVVRLVIAYHARMKYLPEKDMLPEDVLQVIDQVGRADDIENGCIGAVGYLEREAKTDAKGYIKNNPESNQLKVSDEVWEFFQKGEKFDKMKYCKTYADYTLFAAILAIVSLKGKDRELAKIAMELPCKGSYLEGEPRKEYTSALEGYKDIFSRLIEPEKSEQAFETLNGFYKSKDIDEIVI